jgi:hypothetical protein
MFEMFDELQFVVISAAVPADNQGALGWSQRQTKSLSDIQDPGRDVSNDVFVDVAR